MKNYFAWGICFAVQMLAVAIPSTATADNIFLPTASGGVDGNLYFSGITDAGQIGLRLFGGNAHIHNLGDHNGNF